MLRPAFALRVKSLVWGMHCLFISLKLRLSTQGSNVGLVLSVGCWNNTERGSTFETLSAVGVLISALAAVVMIFKGLHLWHTGWDPGLTQMDPSDVARTPAKSRGRVGIILLVVQFFHNFWFLVMELPYGWRVL